MGFDWSKFHLKNNNKSPDLAEHAFSNGRENPLKQVTNGLKFGWNVLYPTTLILWVGGALADKTIKIFSPDEQTTVTRSQLPQSLIKKVQENSTLDYTFESEQKSWQQLVKFRAFLYEYSPSTGKWFEETHRQGKIIFVDNNTFFGYSRQSDYRKWNRQLTLYPAFFNLVDSKKIATIEHEYSHSLETIPGYISNSIAPQVVIGSILKSYGTTESSRELGKNWSYYGNASEAVAIEREKSALKNLEDPNVGHYFEQPNQVIPGQTELGVLITAVSGFLFVRKRKKAKINHSKSA